MHAFPHRYATIATSRPEGGVDLDADGLPTLPTDAPPEFGGPGDRWSPETLLVGAVGNCFILTFRSIARAARLPWASIEVEVEGILDRVERFTRFTRFEVRVALEVPAGVDEDRARQLLERAEQLCLITNSMTAEVHLDAQVLVLEEAAVQAA